MSTNAKKRTRFQGVYSRESNTRKHRNKPDVCFFADFYTGEGSSKKRVQKAVGWASDGITAAYASQARAKMIADSKIKSGGGEHIRNANPLRLEEAVIKYRDEWLIARQKVETIDFAFSHLKPWQHLYLHEITPYILDTIINELHQKKLSPQSIRHVIGLIKRVMRKMEAWGFYEGTMPFAKVNLPKVNNARQRFLNPDEAKTLLNALKERSFTVYMQALIALHCGLRFGEIAALTFEDLDFENNIITIRDSKSGKLRKAVMTDTLKHELNDFLILHDRKSPYIFPNREGKKQQDISKTFERVVESLGFNKASDGSNITDRRQRFVFHSLRHTYASWLAMSGQGQVMIADLLGHAGLEMSKRYTHLFPDARRGTANIIDKVFNHKT